MIHSTWLLLGVVGDGWVAVCRDAEHIACSGQGCWELLAALGCVYEPSFPASALQRGLKMLWVRIIAMGTFQWVLFHQEWCWWETRSFSLPLAWHLSCAAGVVGP